MCQHVCRWVTTLPQSHKCRWIWGEGFNLTHLGIKVQASFSMHRRAKSRKVAQCDELKVEGIGCVTNSLFALQSQHFGVIVGIGRE